MYCIVRGITCSSMKRQQWLILPPSFLPVQGCIWLDERDHVSISTSSSVAQLAELASCCCDPNTSLLPVCQLLCSDWLGGDMRVEVGGGQRDVCLLRSQRIWKFTLRGKQYLLICTIHRTEHVYMYVCLFIDVSKCTGVTPCDYSP